MHLCIVLLAFTTTGCLEDLFPIGDQITCNSSENCPTNHYCHLGYELCIESSQCADDVDCAIGGICVDGLCQDGCREEGDCGLYRACIDGKCQEDPQSCTSDALCEMGETCDLSTNRCIVQPEHAKLCETCFPRLCLSRSDCPDNSPCDGADGQSFGECRTCLDSDNCQYQIQGECQSDSACGAGFFCYFRGCNSTDNCIDSETSPQACLQRGYQPVSWEDTNYAFNIGTCKVGLCIQTSCTSDCNPDDPNACPRGYACFNNIVLPDTSACQDDNDCGAGSDCLVVSEQDSQRYCSCVSNADCPEGRCQNGSCVISNTCKPALGLSCYDF